ncbi:hypothetical protein C2845_PM06G13220 [Panicum miliaceum]|uniref:F-box domain-containing protein n=1 Tax=Panicum miliaceum TaxID=4540 RepID=A0A3L6R4W5_PANMI|nr:hypothetical protein C2845_PM06G13220 [Panicum miliaceum]
MLKRAGAAGLHARAEDDGFRLDDEVLITILSRVAGSTADLVRCAATCRRWRRLVSTNAAFICRHAPRPIRSKSFVRFFHLNNTVDATAPRSLWLGKPLFGGLVRGYGHRVLDASSRVVASRDGLLAAEIRRAGIGSATRQQATRAAIVHRGIVFWPGLRLALLALPTEGAAVVRGLSTSRLYDREGSMLGLMPDGKLCWVDVVGNVMRVSLRSHNGDMLCLHDGSLNGWWVSLWSISLPKVMPEFSSATSVTPRWFYEKSGIFFFTAKIGHGEGGEERCYTLNVSTNKIYEVSRSGASNEPWGDMYGYELDREKFLGSLR